MMDYFGQMDGIALLFIETSGVFFFKYKNK